MKNLSKPDSRKIENLELQALEAIQHHQKDKVVFLFNDVERLYTSGSEYTRSLIATKFIFPLSQILELNFSWGREYLNLFPSQLKVEYCRQINSSSL